MLAPILNIRQDTAETGESAHDLWKTFMVTFPLIERATRVLCDVGYAAAGAILLFGWWNARRTPPAPGAPT